MRVLLASNATYFPPRGGSTRSNLVWLRGLAQAGQACRVICAAPEPGDAGADRERTDQGLTSAVEHNLEITPVADLARKRGVLIEAIAASKPDWILISSEDLAHSLLREAASVALDRIVYLAHTPQFMPFGPESWNPEPKTAQLLRNAAGVVVIGQHMAGYVRQHLGGAVRTNVIHPPIYPAAARIANPGGYWLTVNPCRVKGIEIFLALADRFPQLPFATVPGWGTTASDRNDMARRPNIRVLANAKRIEDVLAGARALLMPSLWYEGFGLIAMEAMLGAVPVISSDSGGLVEAKRGTDYVIPVKPIRKYRADFDDRHMPVPESEPQDLSPWVAAVEELLDPAKWRAESDRSLAAAQQFTAKLDTGQFERYLLDLKPAPAQLDESNLSRLSPAQRGLLLEKIRQRKSS